jgi:uncharacterized DUF497 family protein
MRFEWDERKNRANLRKHGISFELATSVFDDPYCLSIPDESLSEEERFWTIGRPGSLTIVLVVHTWRDDEDNDVGRPHHFAKPTPERQLDFLESLPDNLIDTSDIPELTEEQFRKGVRGPRKAR